MQYECSQLRAISLFVITINDGGMPWFLNYVCSFYIYTMIVYESNRISNNLHLDFYISKIGNLGMAKIGYPQFHPKIHLSWAEWVIFSTLHSIA